MDEQGSVQVTILNANYPPNPGITGSSAQELAVYLIANGVKVSIVCTDHVYSGNFPLQSTSERKIQLKSLYGGKSKLLRLGASLIDSFRMVRKAQRLNQGGWIIVMTDPPFLGFWASLLLGKRKWIYWTMDLYPYAFVAARLVKPKNPVFNFLRKLMLKNPPTAMINLGEFQRDFLLTEYQRTIPSFVLPCGIHQEPISPKVPDWKNQDKIYLGYCGNLGEAHDVDFLMAAIEAIDPTKMVFVLSIYGIHAPWVLSKVASRQGVEIVEHIPREQLGYIDLHVVSLKPEWDNICVPSKAISAVCSGSPILFCGTKKNDISNYLKETGIFLEASPNLADDLSRLFAGMTKKKIDELKVQARNSLAGFCKQQNSAFQGILKYITEENNRLVYF